MLILLRNMYKKKYSPACFRVSIWTVFSFLFFSVACTEQEADQALLQSKSQSETGQVNWIGHWEKEGKKEELVREVANEFEFLNQGVKVNLKFPSETNPNQNDADFIASLIKSPKPAWDIVRLNTGYYQVARILDDPDWGKKYLVDFSEIPEFVDRQLPTVFAPTIKNETGGISPSPYMEGFFYSAWYNKALAEKIGLKIKDVGMTTDDFIGYIKAIYEYNQKNNTDIIPLFENGDWTTTEQLMLQMFYSQFKDYDEALKTEYDPKRIEYLEKTLRVLEAISKYSPFPKKRSDLHFFKAADYPLDQKCFFYINASWMYNNWEGIDNKKLWDMVPAELPTFNGQSACYIGGYQCAWAVLKNSPNLENAIKLMMYWTRADISEKWVRYTKSPTAIKGSLASVSFGLNQFENFEYEMNKKYGTHLLRVSDYRNIFGLKNSKIRIPWLDIIEGKTDVDKVMADIRKQIR
jgi:ABC-type glycerol-3-phosphate transport system substrate-binding protein